ncbi:MAG: Cna B-type domain-containing protein, partial [Clostridiales bacterium]|nr:Cna B-type domain-containing protein [Clostridiales bacterium]
MMNKMKKILALVMAMMMITSSMPVSALAEASDSGSTDGILVYNGTLISGAMDLVVKEGETALYSMIANANVPAATEVYEGGQKIADLAWRNTGRTYNNRAIWEITVSGLAVGYNNSVYVGSYFNPENMSSPVYSNVGVKVEKATEGTTGGDGVMPTAEGDDTGDYKLLESETRYEMKVDGTKVVYAQTWDISNLIGVLNNYEGNGKYFYVTYDEVVAKNGGIPAIYEVTIEAKKAGDYTIEYNSTRITFAVSENTTEVPTYNITFAAGEGGGSMSADTSTGSYELPANGFTAPAGYEFDGWNVNGAKYAVGETITVTGDTTVTATWKQVETEEGGDDDGIDPKYEQLNGNETIRMTEGETRYFTCFAYNSPTQRIEWDAKDYFVVSEENIVSSGEGNGKTYTFALKAKDETAADGIQIQLAGNSKTTFIIDPAPEVEYIVSFEAGSENAGGSMESLTATKAQYTLPQCGFEAPEDYEFDGWDVNGTKYAAGETVTLTGNTTITATWKALPAKVQVVFANLKENTVDPEDTRATYSINLPTGLADATYNFLGWSETEVQDLGKTDAVSSYYNNTYTVSADAASTVTLYAVWQEKPADVTVTFDGNGSDDTVNAIYTQEGAKFNLPDAKSMKKDGALLVGWSTAPMSQLDAEATIPTDVKAPGAEYTMGYDGDVVTTFYAVWQTAPEMVFIEDGKTYYMIQGQKPLTLYYYGNSGNTWTATNNGDKVQLTEGEFTDEKWNGAEIWARPLTINALAPTAEGQRVSLINYYCGLNGSTGQKTFYIVITESTGTVTFDGNNGTDETKTAYAPNFTMPTDGFTKPEGKVLYGWSEAEDTDYLDGTYYAPGYAMTGKDGDQTYYAVWGPEVKIIFNANGGQGTVQGTQAKANTQYTIPGKDGLTAPEGKCFYGWSTSPSTEYTNVSDILFPGAQITLRQNAEYFAVWGPQVTLSYDLNGGSGTVPGSTTDDPGFKVQLATDEGIIAPNGKLFAGWATDVSGTTLYQPGADMTVNSDTVMYAIWVDAATVTFVNEGVTLENLSVTVPAGQKITLPSGNDLQAPESEQDLVFYGWTTDLSGVDTEAETGFDRAGDEVTLDEDATYHAVWGPAKMQITVRANHYYYDSSSNKYKLYETEETILKANNPQYVVSVKDYPENVMIHRTDVATTVSGVADAVVAGDNTSVTFDTAKVELVDYRGTVDVNFYYDAVYTLTYRSDAYTGYKEYEPGKTGFYPYGDRVLATDKKEIWPIDDKVGTWAVLKNAPKSVEGAGGYGDGYANNGNQPYAYQYQLPGETELHDFDSNNLPPPGSTIIYRFKLAEADQITKIIYDQRYLNAFNNQFLNPNKWETMTKNATFEEGIHFGETVTFNLWRMEFDTYEPYHPDLNPIGYYKHSGFQLWMYSDQEFQPNGMTKGEVEALDYTYFKGQPLVITGLYKGYQPRLELLYEGTKPVWYTVEYYVDGVKVYETFDVHVYADNFGQQHEVQPLPSDATSDVWTYKTFNTDGTERTESEDSSFNPYSNRVKVKPGEKFNMIDANIKYYAYTQIDVTYSSENTDLGTVSHDLDQPNGLSGQTVLGSTAQPINNSIFLGWYKGDTLITTDLTLSAEVVHDNLNERADGSITNGWYMDTDFVAKFASADAQTYPYIVKHFFQQPDGSYVENEEFREEHSGIAGQAVSAKRKYITGYRLNPNHPDAMSNGIVLEDGSLELRLYYNLVYKTTYIYEYDENFTDADKSYIEEKYALPGAKKNLKQEDVSDKPADWNVEGNYYIFDGWHAEPENLIAEGNGYKHQKNENGQTVGSDVEYIGVWRKVLMDLTGTKYWEGDNGIAHVNSKELNIRLYRSVNGGAREEVDVAETWYMDNYTFSGLPICDNDGNKYTYTVSEDKVYGYGTRQDGFDFINVLGEIPTLNLKITKVWDDGNDADGLRPDQVSVQIYANDEPYGDPLTITSNENWQYETQLPAETVRGLLEYTLEELTTAGYQCTIEGDMESGYIIRNTHSPETTDVTVTKIWNDDSNRDGIRPETVTLILKNGSEEVDRVTLQATSSNTQSHVFTGLVKNKNGQAINYTVDELDVTGYEKSIDGTTITNSYTPGETSVTVVKSWDDNNDQDGIRPESVEVQLYANGEAHGAAVTLPIEGKWSYTWNGLALKANGAA